MMLSELASHQWLLPAWLSDKFERHYELEAAWA